MLLPVRRQILERDLRIQILALVRVREKRIVEFAGKNRSFEKKRVFSIFFLSSLCLCHSSVAFRAVSYRKSNPRFFFPPFIPDWSTCLRVEKSFYDISLDREVRRDGGARTVIEFAFIACDNPLHIIYKDGKPPIYFWLNIEKTINYIRIVYILY